ncbi:MAG: LysR family transcriptional regulator [Burkholderiaceae bacterium]|nr:LysR family transcriptional regulator [Burkholderiaceae bacterium]
MNTRQLRHFLAVMDLGSLAAAAEAVHLSPPALSRSLRALEDELRVPLFDRQDRRLRPTHYALAYAERARRIVFDEREGARVLALMHAGQAGSLAFGMGSSIALTLLAPLLQQLLAAAPRLRVRTLVQSTDLLVDALRREALDFFVGDVRVAAQDRDLVAEPLHRCSFAWYARRGHPLAGRSQLAFADLADFPLMLSGYADQAIMSRLAQLYGLTLPLDEHFSASTNDVATVLALVATGDAVVPATDVAVVSALRQRSVVRLDVTPVLDLELTLGIVERAGRTRVPAATHAFELVRAYFAAVAAEVAAHRGPPGSESRTRKKRR